MNLDDIPHDEHGGAQLDKATRHARRARFWGKLTLPKPAELKDEEKLNEELPFRSKALEQQHWLEMVDHKVSLRYLDWSNARASPIAEPDSR